MSLPGSSTESGSCQANFSVFPSLVDYAAHFPQHVISIYIIVSAIVFSEDGPVFSNMCF